jgi:hypothetical protein
VRQPRPAVCEAQEGLDGRVDVLAGAGVALARSGMRLGVELRSGARPSERSLILPTRLIGRAEADAYEPWG